MSNAKKSFFIQLCVILVIIFVVQSFFQKPDFPSPLALAAASELHGWAWSSNIGWVSMNCADGGNCGVSDYRVFADSVSGNLSGYAWSSNIGWIQFDPSGPYPAAGPSYSAQIDDPAAASSPLSGWARALSYNVANGEWDGWIKMSNLAAPGALYGVSVSGSKFSGFAWGGDVVGWLSFCDDVTNLYCVTRGGGPSPACPTFTSDPSTIIVARGGSGETTLSWECVNVDPGTCSIDQGIGDVPEKGSRKVTLSYTTTFTLSCSVGAGAEATTFVEVKVFTPDRKEIRP